MRGASELNELALFQDCSAEDLERIATAITDVREFAEGAVICREGDKADRWWIVVEGLADVTVRGIYLATIGPGETIGEMALLDGEPRVATVTAATDVVAQEVRGDDFIDSLLASPRLSLAILREVARRLRATNDVPTRGAAPSAPPASSSHSRSSETVAAGPLDLGIRGYSANPYAQLARLRERAPVHWSPQMDSWLVLRYEDVRRLSRDKSLLGSITTVEPPDDTDDLAPRRRPEKMMIRRDGADHTRLRRLVTKVFTPKAIEAWRAKAEQIVEERLDAAEVQGEVDLIADYALPLPAQVISEMLGVPRGDISMLREWSQLLVRNLEPSVPEELRTRIDAAARAFFDYLEELVTDKRAHPGSDIITDLIAAEEAGDCLDDDEIQAQILLLYIAGHETTVNLIGNGVVALYQHPEQLDLLRTRPDLDANAIEEVLRYESPAQFTRRRVEEPFEVDTAKVEPGHILTLCLGSANHDPAKWGPTADTVDITRTGANEHLSFGGGPHFCLGAALARLEGQIALPRLMRRFPHLTLLDQEPAWSNRVVLRGLVKLSAKVVAS